MILKQVDMLMSFIFRNMHLLLHFIGFSCFWRFAWLFILQYLYLIFFYTSTVLYKLLKYERCYMSRRLSSPMLLFDYYQHPCLVTLVWCSSSLWFFFFLNSSCLSPISIKEIQLPLKVNCKFVARGLRICKKNWGVLRLLLGFFSRELKKLGTMSFLNYDMFMFLRVKSKKMNFSGFEGGDGDEENEVNKFSGLQSPVYMIHLSNLIFLSLVNFFKSRIYE